MSALALWWSLLHEAVFLGWIMGIVLFITLFVGILTNAVIESVTGDRLPWSIWYWAGAIISGPGALYVQRNVGVF